MVWEASHKELVDFKLTWELRCTEPQFWADRSPCTWWECVSSRPCTGRAPSAWPLPVNMDWHSHAELQTVSPSWVYLVRADEWLNLPPHKLGHLNLSQKDLQWCDVAKNALLVIMRTGKAHHTGWSSFFCICSGMGGNSLVQVLL